MEEIALPAGSRDRALVAILAYTGCRVGELTRLKVGGLITALFAATTGYAQVNGIEVYSGATRVLAINCGNVPTGGNSLSLNTVTNAGNLKALNGAPLSVSNLAANQGAIVSDVGSTVTVTGAFSQAAGGAVTVNVAGVAAGNFGVVSISGAATFSQTLNVNIVNGYVPAIGDAFQVMTYGSETGTFGTISVTGLPGGLTITPTYGPTSLTLTIAHALHLADAGSAPTAEGQADQLSQAALDAFASVAIDRFVSDAGLDAVTAAKLHNTHFVLAGLAAGTLGAAAGNTVWIDRSAAGRDWFVDGSPLDDKEYAAATTNDHALLALANGPAAGKVDLLTTIWHELGHVLGVEHSSNPNSLFAEDLLSGSRKLLSAQDVDSLFTALGGGK